MPLTTFQKTLAQLLASNRSPESHLAGGAAIHFEPNTIRYSNDLDYFHDSLESVALAFAKDQQLLLENNYAMELLIQQPGYIRAAVTKAGDATKVEWAHDSMWRFMPVVQCSELGYRLHPVDLAINKVLALAGRDEPRDFLDTLYFHQHVIPLGALCWAAVGKDPGFSALSLLSLLQRRSKYQPQDFARLHLVTPVDLPELKNLWLTALADAEEFIRTRPHDETGCLYYCVTKEEFVQPTHLNAPGIVCHFGRPGGLWPRVEP